MANFFSKGVNPAVVIKLVRFFLILSVVSVCAFLAYFAYKEYQDYENYNKPLRFHTTEPWAWHGLGTQIQYDKTLNRSVFRKISEDDSYILYAHKNNDYSYSFRVLFLTTCTPNSTIKTRQKAPSDEPRELKCNPSGDGLYYDFQKSADHNFGSTADAYAFVLDGSTPYDLKGDLDGFKFHENVSGWDFTKLDQEITLLKASSPKSELTK